MRRVFANLHTVSIIGDKHKMKNNKKEHAVNRKNQMNITEEPCRKTLVILFIH